MTLCRILASESICRMYGTRYCIVLYACFVAAVRKAVRATVVLLPLLGLIYVIFLVNPSDNHISKHVFAYFNSVLQSSQVVALLAARLPAIAAQ